MIEENNPQKRTEIKSLGEFGLIDHLTQDFNPQHQSTLRSIGDDAAVINYKDKCTVVSTDLLIELIHFDLTYVPLKHLGYKAVVVNLSDIYAMNAKPQQITVSIAVSNRFSVEALEEIYAGIKAACEHYQVDLVGGDTTASPQGLVISITAIGCADKKNIIYRNTAKEGDLICVSGNLGSAYVGLQLLEREKQVYMENSSIQPDLEGQDYMIGRQLKPEARKDIIQFFLDKTLKPTSMIDVSDGLSSDLLHICHQSNVGCELVEANIPVDQETYNFAVEKFELDPTMCALNGGEDYELLFTIDPNDERLIEENSEITIVGIITNREKGKKLVTRPGKVVDITAQGWNPLK